MFSNFNFQYLISYLGLIPYCIIILNKYFFSFINHEIATQYSIYYTLIIIVFIGAINWNLEEKIKNFDIIYGFIPSLIASLIIAINLLGVNINTIYFLIILSVTFQLFFDYYLIYSKSSVRTSFYFLRLPLSIVIIISLIIIRL